MLWTILAALALPKAVPFAARWQLLEMVDLNGDGLVDFDEFCQAFAGNARFKALILADSPKYGAAGDVVKLQREEAIAAAEARLVAA